MLNGVDAGFSGNPCAGKRRRMRRNARPAGMNGLDCLAYLLRGEGRLKVGGSTWGPVKHELHEVGAAVELLQCRGSEGRSVLDVNGLWQVSGLGNPGPGREDVGLARLASEFVPNIETESTSLVTWRANVNRPQNPGMH